MKKILLSAALIASMAVSAFAQEDAPTLTQDWGYLVVNKVSNPIPNFTGGWGGKPTEANPKAPEGNVCTRFGVGKDGKILVQYHKNNTISALSANGTLETYAQLPAVTLEKWNGTAIATDDAGNVIYNYCFTDAPKSVKYWGVVDKNKKTTDVTVSEADYTALGASGRLDIISHIVGDVTSAEGGIGYACLANFDKVVMYHFKGDGTKVTSVTAKASSNKIEALPKSYSGGGATQPCAKYLTVKEILAEENPADAFLLPLGNLGVNTETNTNNPALGMLAMYVDGDYTVKNGFGNRCYNTVATFKLQGKQYVVRSYMDENSEMYNTVLNAEGNASAYSTWTNVMTFGVYELETGALVASWQGCGLTNSYGYGTMSVEPVDATTVRIYNYACVGSSYNEEDKSGAASGTKTGAYCVMTTFKVKSNEPTPGEIAGSGTENDPYLISCKEDLCNAYTKTEEGKLVYFKQTADIDMAGVKDYVALVGFDGSYNKSIYYDGNNHVITNFAPVDRIAGTGENAYYNTSLFGTPSGTIKNLGVINANIETAWFEAGVLGGFAGVSQTATSEMNIDNVFVTGKVTTSGNNSCAGGMFGTQAQTLNITNSYVQIEINAPKYAAGFIAQATSKVNVSNSYASSKVTATDAALAVATNIDKPADTKFTNVVVFGDGVATNDDEIKGASEYPAGSATGIAEVQKWAAFNAGKLFNGLPALNWQKTDGGSVSEIAIDENAPVEYYNLSGVRVANPTPGIYVKKQGSKVTKVVVR